MPNPYADLLKDLRNQQWFQDVLTTQVYPAMPPIPAFVVNDDGTDNTSQWKAQSQMREGYKLCLSKLGILIDE